MVPLASGLVQDFLGQRTEVGGGPGGQWDFIYRLSGSLYLYARANNTHIQMAAYSPQSASLAVIAFQPPHNSVRLAFCFSML